MVVVAAACGSGGGGTRASGATLSKQDFIKQGDAICKELSNSGPQEDPKDAKAMADLLGPLIASAKAARDRFAALKAPSDGKQLQTDMVADIDKQIGEAQKAKDQAANGDKDGAEKTLSAIDTTDIDKRASDYGFKDCASGGN